MSTIKTIWQYTVHIILISAALMLDLLLFEQWNSFALQAILCAYIVMLVKPERSAGIITLFIAALALESHILFSHVSYGLYIALFLIPLAMVLRAWIDSILVAALTGLGVILALQQALFLANQQTSSINIASLTGHFLINGLFLAVYWFFDRNGKQGNRSERSFYDLP